MTHRRPLRVLILDACVIIDFRDADPSAITVIASALGQLCVASPVLAEVGDLDESAARSLGLLVVEPELAMFAEAAVKRGGLSLNDHLCLRMAKTEGWVCVSNDRALRRACQAEQVPVLWGLEMMGLAVEAGALPAAEAEEIARRIHLANPMITEELVERFIEKYVRRS